MAEFNVSYPRSAKELLDLCKEREIALTFNDVLLDPQYSEIESRKSISLETYVTPLRKLEIPIIAANMDSICEVKMAVAMGTHGGLGVIHRYMEYEEQLKQVKMTGDNIPDTSPVAAAIGVKNGIVEHATKLAENGCDIIVIDVAHGHHKLVGDALMTLKALNLVNVRNKIPVEYIAGNVGDHLGTTYLIDKGADCVKVGIGSGSICTTRLVTGHGVPQLIALVTSALTAFSRGKTIISDGGIRLSGDIVKALAAGANTVMCGSILAGTDETPGEIIGGMGFGDKIKVYRGMASFEAQNDYYGNSPEAPEGVTTTVPYKGSVIKVLENLIGGVKSGLSYSGCNNLNELRDRASWILISPAAWAESQALIQKKP